MALGLPEGPVAEYFAINLRRARESAGLSQAELAARIADLGQPCTQATIWKLEQGHREPKLSEAALIGQALGVWSWKELTVQPADFDVALKIDYWRKRVFELAEQTRTAAAAQLEGLTNLVFAVRAAQDAGMSVEWAKDRAGWLERTPEMTVLREVLNARVTYEAEDADRERHMAEENQLAEQIKRALEDCGVELIFMPEDITHERPETPDDDQDRVEVTADEGAG